MPWRLLVAAYTLGFVACGWAQNDGATTKIQPLDINKGLWELRIHTTITDRDYSTSNAAVMQALQSLTPQQRETTLAKLKVDEAKQAEQLRKGTDQTTKQCPLNQGFESVNSTSGVSCTRDVTSTSQALDMHFVCRTESGDLGYEQISKFQRIDAENFSGSIRVQTHNGEIGTVTRAFVGRWISDSCSGPPAGYAAKNGLHPKGPAAVADQDPNRVVATIDGKEVTARAAWNQLKMTAPGTRSSYQGGLPALLERVTMQQAIAQEALQLHLDKQAPWKDKLSRAKLNDLQGVQNYAGDPNIPPPVWAHWVDDEHRILWQAYFDQPPTQAGKDELMQKEKERFRITVKDADFFINSGN